MSACESSSKLPAAVTWTCVPINQIPHTGPDWLAASEAEMWLTLARPDRRRQWLAGRIAAKQLVLSSLVETGSLPVDPRRVSIHSQDGSGRAIPPRVSLDGRWIPGHLSLSHTAENCAAVWSACARWRVGIDVVQTGPQLDYSGLLCWLTPQERRSLPDRDSLSQRIGQIWGYKEACFKAAGQGHRFHPLDWEVLGFESGNLRCSWQGAVLHQLQIQRHAVGSETVVIAVADHAQQQLPEILVDRERCVA